MVFLNPAILFGLLAASIPILIHLLNIKKLQRIEFSTLSFLKELQKSKIRKIKIKQWLLLLIRTLIIIALVFAFARPTLEGRNFLGTSSSAKSSIAFVIDNSFSMDYVDEEGSSFNKAKQAVKNIISNSEDGDEFIFIISKDSAKTTTNKESALNILDNIKISLVSQYLTDQLSTAVSIISETQNINKEIYCFSDFQKSTFSQSDIIDSAAVNTGNIKISLYAFDLSSSQINNYSVDDLRLNNSIIELNKPLTFSAVIKNHSNRNIVDLNASLFINEKRVAQRNLKINNGSDVTAKFTTSLETPGLKEVYVELEKDNILPDNYSYLSFFIPEEINILFYFDSNNDIYYLEKAVGSISESGNINITKFKSNDIFNRDLSEFDIVFLVSSKNLTNLNLAEYLNNGGNIFFLPPQSTNRENISELAKSIGLPKVENIISVSNQSSNYAVFGEINYKHPIYSSLFEIQNKKEIESPNLFRYIKFQNNPKVTSIISLIDDSIFLGETKMGSGITIFLNTLPVLEWNTIPVKGVFAPLISRIIYYLVSQENENEYYLTGDPIPLKIGSLTFPIIDVTQPEGNDKINLNEMNNKSFSYKKTYVPGNYKFMSNNKLISFHRVNVNPVESYMNKIEENKLNDLLTKWFDDNYSILKIEENFMGTIKSARYGIELWKYFIFTALFLSLLEMYISRSRKRDLANL